MQNQSPRLGIWTLVALVCGNMIGSGVFLLPSALARYGSISVIAWLFTAAGAILIGLVFANLGGALPKTGGPYAYCQAAFGDFIGFQIAYGYWIALWVGNAAIVVALVGYLGMFWPALVQNHWLSFGVSVSFIWLLTLINIRGVREAGVVQLVTTILKIIPLLLVAVFSFRYMNFEYLQPFNATGKSNFSAITGAATLTLWAFIGLESATVPAESVENPQRNIPRATIIGVLVTAALYILCCTSVMLIIPNEELRQSTAPFADAAKIMFGSWAGWMIAAGAAISCFGTLNGWILMQGQVPMAAAQDNLFPKHFARRNKQGSPYYALIASSVLITLLLLLTVSDDLVNQFTYIILLATLSGVVPYFFTCMGELILFIKYREKFDAKKLTRSSIIAILGSIYSYWVIIGSGQDLVFHGTLLLFSSLPFYVWMRWHQAKEANHLHGHN